MDKCESRYDICVMQGARLYRKFTIKNESFKFTDYKVRMEIRNKLLNKSILFLEDEDFGITDTTLEIDIKASTTKNFPLYDLIYGIELIDKNDNENVVPFITGSIVVRDEIPREEE